jgi:2-polyprenyl-3-methyl-5-hydroxy-6-metoxy-1,4-benzoquinol methylase
MSNPLAHLDEIMRRRGVRCTAEEFQAAVNVTFHRFESEHYDQLHQDMWQSLPAQIALLAGDCLQHGAPESIRMLDIGCGTGLATQSLLQSPLGPRVSEVDLLDSSQEMLAQAEKRRQKWGKPGQTTVGLVESLANSAEDRQYDLIITCSVLHHVPDLESFLGAVCKLQKNRPGAIFLHLQDPNSEFMADPELVQRKAKMTHGRPPEWLARLNPKRVAARLLREIKGEQGQDYLSKTNQALVNAGVIAEPLTTPELFSITDVHIHNSAGISIKRNQNWLPGYELVSRRAYAFFGELASSLDEPERTLEEDLIRNRAQNGEYVGAAWKRLV